MTKLMPETLTLPTLGGTVDRLSRTRLSTTFETVATRMPYRLLMRLGAMVPVETQQRLTRESEGLCTYLDVLIDAGEPLPAALQNRATFLTSLPWV